MEETLTAEMKSLIAALGQLVKADPRCAAIQSALNDYEQSEELNGLITEYNIQQNVLADAFGKTDAADEEFRKTVQGRIDTLYTEIVSHPAYEAYLEAKEAFDGLTNEIFSELQYVITGQRPCTHNCSTCHSDCHNK